jgi:hypothetical protein
MTTKHAHEKDAKHAEKHAKEPEKHPVKDPDPPTRRVELQNATIGDETTIGHGTKSYLVPRDGIVDLPPEVAEHVIRQGGARPLDLPQEHGEGTVTVKHVSDPKATLAYGNEVNTGEFEVPVAILAEIEPHGFVRVDPDGRRSK